MAYASNDLLDRMEQRINQMLGDYDRVVKENAQLRADLRRADRDLHAMRERLLTELIR